MMNPAHTLATSIAEKITLPDVYHNVRHLIAEPDVKIDDFVDVINLDVSLAVHIVEIANSDFFSYSRKVKTVKQALSMIGLIQLHDLLLSSLAIRAFAGIPSIIIDQQAYWRSCAYCGAIARLLAKKCMLPASERFFVLGLLHEIGHLVMYAKIPEKIQDVLINAEQSGKPLFIEEREELGFDYAQVGNEIMKLWNLPDSYTDITRYHIEPEKAQKFQQEIAIVNLARSIMLDEDSYADQSMQSSLGSLNEVFNLKISDDDLEDIKVKSRTQVDDILSCLMSWQKDRL